MRFVVGTTGVRLAYRPIRVGFCVRHGNSEDLAEALRLSLCFWGGAANPILAVGGPQDPAPLVGLFRLDCLFAIGDDASLTTFVERFPHLPWPGMDPSLFAADGYRNDPKAPRFVDISVPLEAAATVGRSTPSDHLKVARFTWTREDPLRSVFLALFGGFPEDSSIPDYGTLFQSYLLADEVPLNPSGPVPGNALNFLTPTTLSRYGLTWDRLPGRLLRAVYVGSASEADDLVTFWNLRAAGLDLAFFDPSFPERLGPLCRAHVLRDTPEGARPSPESSGGFAVLSRGPIPDSIKDALQIEPTWYRLTEDPWTAYHIIPAVYRLDSSSVLGTLENEAGGPRVSFQLPPKSVIADASPFSNLLATSVVQPPSAGRDSDYTFSLPDVPELNRFFGHALLLDPRTVRVERGGFAVIASSSKDYLSLQALNKTDLLRRFFGHFGIRAVVSKPGRIASRLIRQMGGLQGCRVFKIAGVRELLRKYGPTEYFERTEATKVIGERDEAGQLHFEKYQNLFIEPRAGGMLRPEDALGYLLDHDVFRVGVELRCPRCELDFWISLDDAKSSVPCELCGEVFRTARLLHKLTLKYRPSGLFSRGDHQEGAIPVAITLQQLDTVFMGEGLVQTAMAFEPDSASIQPCETDFVVLRRGFDDISELVIGECKSEGGEITEDDVKKLAAVANVFPPDRVRAYVLFSKTGEFSDAEVERCRAAQDPRRRRVILLSGRELEPYWVYEKTAKEYDINRHPVSLSDLATGTDGAFLNPRRRQ